MKKSFFLKIFGWYVVIVLALGLLVSFYSFRTIRRHFIDNQAQHLENLAQTLKLTILPFVEEGRLEEMNSFLKELGKKIQTRITVIDNEGVVLADSEEDYKKMENHRYRPEIQPALQGKIGQAIRWSDTVRQEMLYVGLPLEKGQKVIGVLRVSLFLKDIQHLLAQINKDTGRAAVILLLLMVAMAFFVSRSLSRPVKDLIEASRKVASGNFDIRVYPKGKNEIRDLAENFNDMTEEIRRLFENLARQKEELESILASIQEGLLVLDKDGKVIRANQSLKNIIQNDEVEGRFYWEVVRSSQFGELITEARGKRVNLQGEFDLMEKDYLASASYLPSPERLVVTVHDLTEMRRLERIKKDFVLNVSHELRTPLTAIKGFVETLEGEVEEKDKNYLGIIKRNTERMINIVKDLLLLAELEEKEVSIQTERLDLTLLVQNVLKIFEPKAKEKALTFEVSADPELPLISADPFAIEQMFVNLIDNAVKYTEKGGVRISLRKGTEAILIDVEDTGMGIPPEHLDRIFERFYVVDKSRSKKLGGTGLGLAIVKHIVLAHHGQISVKSQPDQGTTFSVILPLKLP
jgi:two-component system, OmpR family, phosphate regulon sensor histidine kinase PhoR